MRDQGVASFSTEPRNDVVLVSQSETEVGWIHFSAQN